jgi:hypothetical protein
MNKKQNLFPRLAAFGLIAILILSSCSMPTAAVSPQPLATPTLETVALATLTAPSTETSTASTLVETATETAVTATTFTPTPTSTATATSTPAAGCDLAEFVTDVTYPDDSNVKANTDIIKTWRIKNTGSCTWDSNYKLVFIRGEQMNGPSPAVVITGTATPSSTVTPVSPVAPGSSVDLSVPMKVPAINGTHWGVWQLWNAAGKPVLMADGKPQELTIKIVVTDGTGGKVTSIRGWEYTYVGTKCGAAVQYDFSTTIYANGAVNVSYTWSASNGLLTVVTQNYVFTNAGNVKVTTHVSPPFADPNNIRLTLTANGVSSSFAICP